MARILILIGGHLSTAPRPQKEALALCSLGHQVEIRGVWYDEKLVAQDRELIAKTGIIFKPALDFRRVHIAKHLSTRIARRSSWFLYQRLGVVRPELFGYGATALLREARQLRADLTIAHSEAAMWACASLQKAGYKVGIDMEDWFSEDLPESERVLRPLERLKSYEQQLLTHSTYVLAPSNVMAEALSRSYHVPKPTVLYNIFPLKERESLDHLSLDKRDSTTPSIHWFSHSIGLGRGLEILLSIVKDLPFGTQIHLRGISTKEIRSKLLGYVPQELQKNIFFHERVSPGVLLSRIAEHDIGLVYEDPSIPSRDLSVTNKLFQYMLAGIGVIASDTQGQREVMSRWAQEHQIVPWGEKEALIHAIRTSLEKEEVLSKMKKDSLQQAEEKFHFEKQIPLLEDLVERALDE